jgi:glycosyltransferase involved in cell wall biosynthesis
MSVIKHGMRRGYTRCLLPFLASLIFLSFRDQPIDKTKVLVIAVQEWKGIYSSAQQLGLPMLGVAANFFQDPYVPSKLLQLARDEHYSAFLICGIPNNALESMERLKQVMPGLKAYVAFHGSFGQFALSRSDFEALKSLLIYQQKGVIDKIGYLKPGMAKFLTSFGPRGKPLHSSVLGNMYTMPPTRLGKLSTLDNRFHIAVFSTGTSALKNTLNQIAAACLIHDAIVHINSLDALGTGFIKIGCHSQIVAHGEIPHDIIPFFVGMMDLVLYVSYTECSPMLVLESSAAGTPVISSDTSTLYDRYPYLKEHLLVSKFDDIQALSDAITAVRPHIIHIRNYLPHFISSNNQFQITEWNKYLGTNLSQKYLSNQPKALKRAPVIKPSKEQLRICFLTSELGNVMPGGMGRLLDALIQSLVHDGVYVSIVADVSMEQANMYKDKIGRSLKESSRLVSLYRIDDIPQCNKSFSSNWYLHKASRYNCAVRFVASISPFHILEGFDYFGSLYVILRERDHILNEVTIVNRLHGTMLMIDMVEDSVVGGFRARGRHTYLSYVMETYSLYAADMVVSNSAATLRVYMEFYPHLSNMTSSIVIPPPMRFLVPPEWRKCSKIDNHTRNVYLNYGKQQSVKGTQVIVKAAVSWLASSDLGVADAHFLFIGPNLLCPRLMCVLQLIPTHLRDRFTFKTVQSSSDICDDLSRVRMAIFASYFETFCLAAHEMLESGVPIMISDAPAFADHFSTKNAIVFERWSVLSLVTAFRNSTNTTLLKFLGSNHHQIEPQKIITPAQSYRGLIYTGDARKRTKQFASILNRYEELIHSEFP